MVLVEQNFAVQLQSGSKVEEQTETDHKLELRTITILNDSLTSPHTLFLSKLTTVQFQCKTLLKKTESKKTCRQTNFYDRTLSPFLLGTDQ